MADKIYWQLTGLIAVNCVGILAAGYTLINGTGWHIWTSVACAVANGAGAIYWLYKLAKSEGVL